MYKDAPVGSLSVCSVSTPQLFLICVLSTADGIHGESDLPTPPPPVSGCHIDVTLYTAKPDELCVLRWWLSTLSPC